MSRKRQLHAVDLFAGCGGLSLGLHQAGFDTLAYSEINKDAADTYWQNLGIPGKVERIGAVAELSGALIKKRVREWKDSGKEVDLVAGGPPCQGYSGIGHRRSYAVERNEVPSNHLFREMVRVVKAIQPKFFLFENVKGLTTGRWTVEGEKGEIWDEVRETFGNLKGYDIGWQLVQAKNYGVPQNRPRILLIGARRDLDLGLGAGDSANALFNPRGLIPQGGGRAPHLVEVLDDLDDPKFSDKPSSDRYWNNPGSEFQAAVRMTRDARPLKRGAPLTEQEYTRHSPRVTAKFEFMLAHNGEIPAEFQTKKFAQRVLPREWNGTGPTITATSLPDDFVHYARPRILTVREWARLQTFPDWFTFSGPRTTGGLRRAGVPTEGIWDREVPKYTQIGNAVPVFLAKAIGGHIASLLNKL